MKIPESEIKSGLHDYWLRAVPAWKDWFKTIVINPEPIRPNAKICPDCNGSFVCPVCQGNKRCFECDGKQLVRCETCDGDKKVYCDICRGTQIIQCQYCMNASCLECQTFGPMKDKCKACDEGTVTCDMCDGEGSLLCSECQGDGDCGECEDGHCHCDNGFEGEKKNGVL